MQQTCSQAKESHDGELVELQPAPFVLQPMFL
jgi:hypothetical protein